MPGYTGIVFVSIVKNTQEENNETAYYMVIRVIYRYPRSI